MPNRSIEILPKDNTGQASISNQKSLAKYPDLSAESSFGAAKLTTLSAANPTHIRLSSKNINFLHHNLGNRAVRQIMQTKFKPHQPTDQYEQGINRSADEVKSMSVFAASSARVKKKRPIKVNSRSGHKPGSIIQRAPQKTHMGEFKDKVYTDYVRGGKKYGVKIELEFHPGNKVNAKKIGMTQAVKITYGGTPLPNDPTRSNRAVKSGAAKGFFVDRISSRDNPVYGGPGLGRGKNPKDTPLSGGNYKLGYRYNDAGGLKDREAWIFDRPISNNQTPKSSMQFETTALALDGAQKGTYYGSVKWGWERDAAGTFNRIPLTLVSKGTPSSNFMEAAKEWNKATALGTLKTVSNPTNVYQNNHTTVKFTVAKGTKVTVSSGFGTDDMEWMSSTIVDGARAGQQGLIKVTDLKDVGDGAATIDLPLTQKKFTNYPNVWLVNSPVRSAATRIAKLAKNSEVQVIDKGPAQPFNTPTEKWWKISVVNSSRSSQTGKVGWAMKTYLSDTKVK